MSTEEKPEELAPQFEVPEDLAEEEQYEEDTENYIEENYIEINENSVISFPDWIYDALLNKTIKELSDNYMYDLVDFIIEGKRENSGFISLLHLEPKDYRLVIKYFRSVYYKSKSKKAAPYIRKAHNIFIKEVDIFIQALLRDERFLTDPSD